MLERGRAGSLNEANTTARCVNACSMDDGNKDAASGADPVIEGNGASQGRMAQNANKATSTCSTKKIPHGHHLEGEGNLRFETGALSAGNDCDALCSAMEQGRDGPWGNRS